MLAKLHSKDKEIITLKEKIVDLNNKYKKLQRENCYLKLKCSYLHNSKKQIKIRKPVIIEKITKNLRENKRQDKNKDTILLF